MPLAIRSEEVNRLAEKVAARAGVSGSEAAHRARVHEIERKERGPPHAFVPCRFARSRKALGAAPGIESGDGRYLNEASDDIPSARA
ncbi:MULTISPECIES: type II toxin-antitoxin system VapB family antitoxin [Methylobacterium]|uniref:type II toxin-antitoxin system VapB family antitoxin n=1 Tax=Methylobacterium TaxID=407 RepID=UPI000A495852|nr:MULTISPECIES: type II toxin-antitoxin system VapB family antitoxin [Methylobacterium]MCI9879909.1 type II toxin-antitoxin system VapB family antitoxin [Methylobacterium goesingense]